MKELKLSTKAGKKVYAMGNTCYARDLRMLYNTWSKSKQVAYEVCYEEYLQDPNSSSFGLGNANTFGFTCSWLSIIDYEDVMIVKTRSSDYLVWLER